MIISFLLASLAVGFIAQIIDGALGMAYGVVSNSFLLLLGIPPVISSACVHFSEIFTTGASGLSHLRCGNVDGKLASSLLIPGIIGGAIGAYILTKIPGETVKPVVAVYLAVMGLVILRRAYNGLPHLRVQTKLAPLGFIGGLCDAIGGGGWGPIVTSTLVARGQNPRYAVGSVDLTEFFVTAAQSGIFFITIGLPNPTLILGLIAGGVLGAPLSAIVCKRIPAQTLMVAVGILIIVLSVQMIVTPLKPSLIPNMVLMLHF